MLALLVIPLVGAIVTALGSEKESKVVALGWTVLSLVVAAASLFAFDWTIAGDVQFEMRHRWIRHYGIDLWIGADSVSLMLVVLTALLGPICVLGSFTSVKERTKLYYASLLALQAFVTGVFIAQDAIMFYVFFELTLAPMYVLIRQWGGANRKKAATKFFLYTFTGSILTLAGVVFVSWARTQTVAGSTGWVFGLEFLADTARLMSTEQQMWVLAAMLAGFAVKVPLFPVHTWLPLAHTEAPTAGSVVLAGVLLKLGTYALYRLAIPLAPEAFVIFAPYIAVVSIIGILYAGLICWAQRDVKKLVAYSSVSHLGFCILGLVALNAVGVGGSILYMLNHGLSTGALFLCIGMIYERYHTRDMDEIGGLASKMPVWAFFMVFFTMASVGLPGLNGFVSEFMCLLGAFQAGALWGPGGTGGVLGPWFAAFAAVGMVIAAMYLLYMVGKVVFGPLKEPAGHHAHEVLPTDLSAREITVLTPLAIACLVLGVYPTPVIRALEAPINTQLAFVEPYFPVAESDPVLPAHDGHTDDEDHSGHDHSDAGATGDPIAAAPPSAQGVER